MGGVGLVGEGGNPYPLVGQLIKGKYRLTCGLATGSLGVVYLAEQLGTGTRLVLKIFRIEFGQDNQLIDKLRRQMLAVAALSEKHSHIVRVYDCDQAEDGSPFIAMEQLAGRTLRDVMQEAGPLEIGRALSLAGQMAAGLNAAHDAGIVHTDVHPQNFMVLGKDEAIKIIGFERARLRSVGALDHLVPASGISRTPAYVAPEQIQRGQRGNITHQTDIYSFGVVLYEMLTGVVPFQAATPDVVLAMHLQTAPTPLKELRQEIPVEVEARVLQALEKAPKWRENTANEVVGELLHEFVPGRSRAKVAPIRGLRTAIQTGSSGVRPIAPKRQLVGARWALAAISGLLILIAAAAVWMLIPRKVPEVTYQPPAQQRPKEAPERGSTTVGESKEEATEKPPPVPVLKKTAPSASRPKQADTKSSQRTRPPAPSASTVPDTRTGSPDPSEIIDWLLKQPGAAKP